MNYSLNKGHMKAVFTELPDGNYFVTQYQFIPGHQNWVPFSGEQVTAQKAMELMKKLSKKEFVRC